MGQVLIAEVNHPELLERFFIEAIKLSVERAEVNTIARQHRRTAHAGETVRVFHVAAEVPAERFDDRSGLNVNLVQRTAIATAVRCVLVVGQANVDEAVGNRGHRQHRSAELQFVQHAESCRANIGSVKITVGDKTSMLGVAVVHPPTSGRRRGDGSGNGRGSGHSLFRWRTGSAFGQRGFGFLIH